MTLRWLLTSTGIPRACRRVWPSSRRISGAESDECGGACGCFWRRLAGYGTCSLKLTQTPVIEDHRIEGEDRGATSLGTRHFCIISAAQVVVDTPVLFVGVVKQQ